MAAPGRIATAGEALRMSLIWSGLESTAKRHCTFVLGAFKACFRILYMNVRLPITITVSKIASGQVKSTRTGFIGDWTTTPFGSAPANR